jgi:probable HAF family extracellular repeat protein
MKGAVMKVFSVVLFLAIGPFLFADYSITYLGSFNGPSAMSRPLGINESGHVVGWSVNASGQYRAFLWDNVSGIQDIGDLGGGISMATGINDAGQIVGSSRNNSGQFRPFIWDNVNGIQSFSGISSQSSIGVKINNSGQVAGGFYDTSGKSQAFYWDSSNGTQLLGNLNQNPIYAPQSQSEAAAINNNGQVVGWADDTSNNDRAFLWDSANGMQNLGSLGTSGGNYSWSRGINDFGQVVGSSNNHAFLWDTIDGMQDIGTLGGNSAIAYDINNYGQIVGQSSNSLSQNRATLWDNEATYDLNVFLPADSDFFLLTQAIGINDNGQIIGLGYLKSGYEGMFLMTPVPEPATIALLGLGGLLIRRKK